MKKVSGGVAALEKCDEEPQGRGHEQPPEGDGAETNYKVSIVDGDVIRGQRAKIGTQWRLTPKQ